MTAPTIPVALDTDGMTEAERRQFETRQAMRAEGLLLQMIPADIALDAWTIRHDGIEITPAKAGSDDEQRFVIRRLARSLPGFEFAERPHTATMNRCSAVGQVNGIRVELWNALRPCNCKCHGGA